jgi:aryl-alcohol dehydrogenase
MVFGHEGAGVVEAVGSAVSTVAPGDLVCLSFHSCGACEVCAAGRPAYCLDSAANSRGTRADGSTPLTASGRPVYGSFFGQSSFATHAITRETNAVRVPDGLSPVLAAPLGCGVQTGAGTVLNVLEPSPGESLVVFGAGAVGLSAVMAARAVGCSVVAVDPVESRRDLALSLGAADAVAPGAELRDLTGGGAHHAIDTTGRSDVIGTALATLRREGTLAVVGIGGRAEFDIMTVMTGGLRIRDVIEGDAVPADMIPRLAGLHRQGLLPLEKLVVEYPFADIERAAADAASGRTVKPVLTFA